MAREQELERVLFAQSQRHRQLRVQVLAGLGIEPKDDRVVENIAPVLHDSLFVGVKTNAVDGNEVIRLRKQPESVRRKTDFALVTVICFVSDFDFHLCVPRSVSATEYVYSVSANSETE